MYRRFFGCHQRGDSFDGVSADAVVLIPYLKARAHDGGIFTAICKDLKALAAWLPTLSNPSRNLHLAAWLHSHLQGPKGPRCMAAYTIKSLAGFTLAAWLPVAEILLLSSCEKAVFPGGGKHGWIMSYLFGGVD